MRKKYLYLISMVLISVIAYSACESNLNTTIEDSFADIKQVTPISGIQIENMEIQKKDDQNGYLTVRLNNGQEKEAWCIEWNEEEAFGIQDGAKLYTTKGHQPWAKLNYFMGIKNDLRTNDPELTSKEIQVVIWSLIDNPAFDVDKISEYENLDSRVYKDGQPLFNVQKVKNIVAQVENRFASAKQKVNSETTGVVVLENDGQTIIIGDETAFAVKTRLSDEQKIADSDYSTCFDEEILPTVSFNNWGWTNGPISESASDMKYDIYAGAGQCDLDKGTLVGELTVNYANGTLTVTYNMTEESDFTGDLFTMSETHLYVGNDPYPMNRGGRYTVSPGQYGNQNNHNNVTEYTYEIDGLSGDIYFIAHAEVNGFNPDIL